MPTLVSIQHYGSEQKYEFPLKWDANGVAETRWSIPKDAKLGNYDVLFVEKRQSKKIKRLTYVDREGEEHFEDQNYETARKWNSGNFRVEEFRIPLTKGTVQPPATPLVKAKEVTLDLNVQYLAGGAASLLPVKLRYEIGPKFVPSPEGFEDFVFGNGPVKEGVVRRGEAVESEEEGEGEDGGAEARRGTKEGEACECGSGPDRLGPAGPLSPICPKRKRLKRYLLRWSSGIPMVRSRPSLREFLYGILNISSESSRIRGRFRRMPLSFTLL
jgi:hypothetical protein